MSSKVASFGFEADDERSARERFRQRSLSILFVIALSVLLGPSHDAHAQLGRSGEEHVIYGEFKVDESKAGGMVPISFVLVLTTTGGREVGRQSVMPDTRYRFVGVRNGFYDLVVESAGEPVVRIRVQLASSHSMELKQDIFLAWDKLRSGKPERKNGTVSAANYYNRTAANQGLFDKATSAIKKKKFDEATALLKRIIEADPKDYLAWTDLGTMQFAMGDGDEAERSYVRALAERPDLLAASVNLGRLRVGDKAFDKAIEVLKPAVAQHPGSADATHLLGEAYLQTGKYEEAVSLFGKALALDPQGKAEIHLRLAMLYDAAGRKDKAAAELKQFLRKRPNYPDRKKFDDYVKLNKQ